MILSFKTIFGRPITDSLDYITIKMAQTMNDEDGTPVNQVNYYRESPSDEEVDYINELFFTTLPQKIYLVAEYCFKYIRGIQIEKINIVKASTNMRENFDFARHSVNTYKFSNGKLVYSKTHAFIEMSYSDFDYHQTMMQSFNTDGTVNTYK